MIERITEILAFAAPAPGGGDAGGLGSMAPTLIMLALLFGVMYFMMIRPQQKRQKEHQKMLSALQKGDKVMTTSGMIGNITQVDDKFITIQIAPNVNVQFDRNAVTAKL